MDEKNSIIGKIFFKKYQILKLLGSGEYSKVFLAKNIKNNSLYAAKLEEKEKYKFMKYLEKEAYFLYSLQGFGIPEIITYGHSGKYNILIQQLLGKSLTFLFDNNKNKNKIKDLCMAAIQIIERIEFIHSKFILHHDIKPDNFLVGYPDNKNIYLIDFGLSGKYRSSRTKKHINFLINDSNPGTAEYLSLNASFGIEQTRRDDLESVAYMLIRLGKGKLLWNNVKAKNKIEYLVKIYDMKKYISVEKLCQGLPKEFCIFTKYVRNLKFKEQPNYDYLKKLFLNALKKMGEENDLNFSWINSFERNNSNKIISHNLNTSEKKSLMKKRLINKIKDSNLSKTKINNMISYNEINKKSKKTDEKNNYNSSLIETNTSQKLISFKKNRSEFPLKMLSLSLKQLNRHQIKNNNNNLANIQNYGNKNIKNHNIISFNPPYIINLINDNIKNKTQIETSSNKNSNLIQNESFSPKSQRTKKALNMKKSCIFNPKDNYIRKINSKKKDTNNESKTFRYNSRNNNLINGKSSLFLQSLYETDFCCNNINYKDLETDINYYNGDRNRIYNLLESSIKTYRSDTGNDYNYKY